MKVVAVIGQKGGTGKTTTAENLAVVAAEEGKSVALIDLDSQPTASSWGDRRKTENVTVVSAQIARLRHVLDAAKKEGAELVVLDTPPRTSEATLEAAKAADVVLVPVRPIINDMETLPALRAVVTFAGEVPAFVVINAAPTQGSLYAEAQRAAQQMGLMVPENLLIAIPENLRSPGRETRHDGIYPDGEATQASGGDAPPPAKARDPGSAACRARSEGRF